MSPLTLPEKRVSIFWVVGTATDVGKTTVAEALIRCLNAHAVPAAGFKPIAGIRFRKFIDHAVEYGTRLPGRMFGEDCLLLARASPLTAEDDADLVTPWQLVFNRTIDDTLLIRTGSRSLNNVQYFTTEAALKVFARADMARLAQMLALPLDSARVFDPQKDSRMQLAPDAHAQAFAALLQRGPRALVVEGAGPFLPTWHGAPPANHVIVVTPDEIVLHPKVNVKMPHADAADKLAQARHLQNALAERGVPPHRISQCMVEAAAREKTMEKLMGRLLTKADF